MKVLFYGRLAEAIGAELEVDAQAGCSVAELRDRLLTGHPEIAETLRSRHARAFISDRLVHDDHVLRDGETVEFLPPVSGG
jgi:molybdopterin converting factor small subunit